VAIDKALQPREILSPAVARNGFASFHIAVSVPPKESYFLYVVTNPIEACRVALYKEHFVRTASGWIPERLTEIHRLPDFGVMPDPDDNVEGQNTRVYLLDLWIPPTADLSRFRVEVQLKVADWTVVPMEVRTMRAQFPNLETAKEPVPLPPVEAGADAAAARLLGGGILAVDAQPLTVRSVLYRNAVQDRKLSENTYPNVVPQRASEWMRANFSIVPRLFGAEWYLRIRDHLFSR
jgi:hypothetical protein